MAQCYSENTADLRGLSTPTRNNYFYGKLLDVPHFVMEQRYFNKMRWLLNRLSLGSGVLCGLELRVADGELAVLPGAAVDVLGREIIVPLQATIDPRAITDECGRVVKTVASGTVTICLAYHPCAAELVPVLVEDCETREGCAPSTIREAFAVLVREGAPPAYAPACPLPGLFVPPSGQAHGTIPEIYAELLALVGGPCPDPGSDLCVVLGQVTLPTGGAALAQSDVQYAGRRVVLSNARLFELLLCLWERVEQCCGNGAPGTTPTPPPPTATPLPTAAPPTPTPPPPTGEPPPTAAPPPPTATPLPTSEPPPTVAPTVAPSPTPQPSGPPPTTTPPPTAAPPINLLRVRRVRVLRVGDTPNAAGIVVGELESPVEGMRVRQSEEPNAIDVVFDNAAVEFNSVLDGQTFIVDAPGGPLPGQVIARPANTVRWVLREPRSFRGGEYKVVLVADGEPAIQSQDGHRLDGEPREQLPSGDGNEGGDFVFGLRVV